MVLLARTQGIAARVVTGYRVPPASSITGRTIVRERNAHAWVEAWVDGAWHAYDPTPISESMAGGTTMEDVGELVSMGLELAWDAIGKLSLVKTLLLLGVLVVAFVVVRRVTGARGRRGKRGAMDALPSYDALAAALARSGVLRDESEPLETFARRVRTREEPWANDVATALYRYAALRYGGIGDEADVADATHAAAGKIR
jgi:transglutaminase-like putative cysteine protease